MECKYESILWFYNSQQQVPVVPRSVRVHHYVQRLVVLSEKRHLDVTQVDLDRKDKSSYTCQTPHTEYLGSRNYYSN